MGESIEGGCRCGSVRYALAVDALPPVYACHCHICQRMSGSAFSLQALVAEASLDVSGPIVTREITTEDRTSVQRFCGSCLARIYNTNTRRPGIAVIRAGTLDRSEELECRAHIYTATKQAWFAIADSVPSWPDVPDATFAALMMRRAA